jgi:plasmid stabilization system protein ParE
MEVYDYSIRTFGYLQAERYDRKIETAIESLPYNYTAHAPCRHIPTKSHMYRNIILDAHLIIYRITADRIEVLDIVHGASSISKIRRVRKVRL